MSFWKSLKLSLFGHIPEPRQGKQQIVDASLIITAKVEKIEKHPNADRLRVVSVNTGNIVIEPVVCGATNFSEGDIVALALPGAQIAHNIHSDAHESFTLEKATIRGVESQGMLCAGFELGLSETPETREQGIIIFPVGTALGKSVYDIDRG